MRIERDPEDFKIISKVARKSKVVKVTMISGNFELAGQTSFPEKLIASLSVLGEIYNLEEKSFTAKVTITFKGVRSEDDKTPKVSIVGSFILYYSLHDANEFTEDEIKIFCEVNAVYNAWPFLREYISSVLARLDLPQFALPLLKLSQTKTQNIPEGQTLPKKIEKKALKGTRKKKSNSQNGKE